MKPISHSRSVCLIFSITLLAAFSCKDVGKTGSMKNESAHPLHLCMRATVGTADLHYDTLFHTNSSRAFTVSDFRYYISNVKAIRDDGVVQNMKNTVLLIDPGKREYDPGSLPTGTYKAIRFVVGLDSLTNHSDPTVFAAGTPLSIQTPSMHWDWNSGYLFMKLEGKVDTSQKATGAPDCPFFYHLGMDTVLREVDVPIRFSVSNNSADTVRLKFDLAVLLGCIDMKHETSTHSFDNPALAQRMANQWQNAFSQDK
jgi:hypothetical protein